MFQSQLMTRIAISVMILNPSPMLQLPSYQRLSTIFSFFRWKEYYKFASYLKTEVDKLCQVMRGQAHFGSDGRPLPVAFCNSEGNTIQEVCHMLYWVEVESFGLKVTKNNFLIWYLCPFRQVRLLCMGPALLQARSL